MPRYWKVAVVAFAAMFLQDVLATCMVVFESRLNAVVAASFDVAGWFAWLACSGVAIEEVVRNGWRTRRALTIIAAVSTANFVGTVTGVTIASRLR